MYQPAIRVNAVRAGEAVQRDQRACRGDLEDRAIAVSPALDGCSVEVSVAALDQRAVGSETVGAIEAMQRGQRAAGGDFEDHATVVGPSSGPAVEVPVAGLQQRSVRTAAGGAIPLRAKGVNHTRGAAGGDAEDRTIAVASAQWGNPIEVAIAALQQSSTGVLADGKSKTIQSIEGAAVGRDLKHRAQIVVPAVVGHSIKVAVAARHQWARIAASSEGEIKEVQHGECSAGGDFEDGAYAVRSA